MSRGQTAVGTAMQRSYSLSSQSLRSWGWGQGGRVVGTGPSLRGGRRDLQGPHLVTHPRMQSQNNGWAWAAPSGQDNRAPGTSSSQAASAVTPLGVQAPCCPGSSRLHDIHTFRAWQSALRVSPWSHVTGGETKAQCHMVVGGFAQPHPASCRPRVWGPRGRGCGWAWPLGCPGL